MILDAYVVFHRRKGCIFYQDDGGFIATDKNDQELNEIYHMGVIDILTPFNWLKRVENKVRSMQHDPEKISAVEPRLYASRFVSFLVDGVAAHVTTPRNKRKDSKGRSESSDSMPDIPLSVLPTSQVSIPSASSQLSVRSSEALPKAAAAADADNNAPAAPAAAVHNDATQTDESTPTITSRVADAVPSEAAPTQNENESLDAVPSVLTLTV